MGAPLQSFLISIILLLESIYVDLIMMIIIIIT